MGCFYLIKKVCVLAIVMIFGLLCVVSAENSYHLAGFEGDSDNRQWSSGLFFTRWSELFDLELTLTQYSNYADWQKEIGRYLTGAELPDALIKAELSAADTLALYEKGIIIDLKPLIHEYMPNLFALLTEFPQWEHAITLPNGAIAALPGLTDITTNNAMWINQKWLDVLRLEVPTDRESFERVLAAFKSMDPNRNGKQDEIPFGFLGVWDLKFLAHAFGLIANDYNLFVDVDGVVRHIAYQPEFRNFVLWLTDLYAKGLLDPGGFVSSDTIRQMSDANAPLVYGMFLSSSPVNIMPQQDTSGYEVLMPFVFNQQQTYRELTGNVARGAFAITSACQNPKKLLSAIDYFYCDAGAMLAQAGVENVEYSVNEEGLWMWITDDTNDIASVIKRATIADGGAFPYYQSAQSMLRFADESVQKQIRQLYDLSNVCVMPYPLVVLNNETQNTADTLQLKLGAIFETYIGRCVLGQITLDDASWNGFLSDLDHNSIQELIDIFQTVLDNQTGSALHE